MPEATALRHPQTTSFLATFRVKHSCGPCLGTANRRCRYQKRSWTKGQARGLSCHRQSSATARLKGALLAAFWRQHWHHAPWPLWTSPHHQQGWMPWLSQNPAASGCDRPRAVGLGSHNPGVVIWVVPHHDAQFPLESVVGRGRGRFH